MKFPEFDELGNMIGQGFDSGAQVLNNPGVQGLLAAGLGAASQVGKRNVGPLNTLGAAGLAGLGAYGLGRNVNSRNEYQKARIDQINKQNDLNAATLVGQKEWLGGNNKLQAELAQINQKFAQLKADKKAIHGNIPFSPEVLDRQGYEKQQEINAYKPIVADINQRLSVHQRGQFNPALKEKLTQDQKVPLPTPEMKNWNFAESLDPADKAKFILRSGPNDLQSINSYLQQPDHIQRKILGYKRADQVIPLGGTIGINNPLGAGLDKEFPVTPKETETPGYKARVKTEETSAAERTKNAEEIYKDYVLSGKGAMATLNLSRISTVLEKFENDPNLTGYTIGAQPDWLLKGTNPQAWAAKQDIESVIQPQMKEMLGAQFAEGEGVRVLERAVDWSLPVSTNIKRMQLLKAQIQAGHDAKMGAVQYMYDNGSLQGYEGKVLTIDDYSDKALGYDKLDEYNGPNDKGEASPESQSSKAVLPWPEKPSALTLTNGGRYRPKGSDRDMIWNGKELEDIE